MPQFDGEQNHLDTKQCRVGGRRGVEQMAGGVVERLGRHFVVRKHLRFIFRTLSVGLPLKKMAEQDALGIFLSR